MAFSRFPERFVLLDQSVEDLIEQEANQNTKAKTLRDAKLFRNFLQMKGEEASMENIPTSSLDAYMTEFIFRVRRADGGEYEPTSIRGIISSIQRYINSKDSSRGFNIFQDSGFVRTINALKAKSKQLKKQGKGEKPNEASALTDQDIDILYSKKLLGMSTPESVINTLWYNNCYYFGMRGCTENKNMKWGDLVLQIDSEGREFVEKIIERQTKTRQGDDIRNTRQQKGRMYAVPGSNRCPVAPYKFYKDMRPNGMSQHESPFYLAINNIQPGSMRPWFKSSPMGINKLNSLMKVMANKAGLKSSNLTNHSVRKRLVQKLVSSDVPPTEIMQITGHKNVQSINNYSTLCETKKRKLSDILSNAESSVSSSRAREEEVISVEDTLPSLFATLPTRTSMTSSTTVNHCPLPNSLLQNAVFLGGVTFNFGSQKESKAYEQMSMKLEKKRIIIDSDSD